MIVCVRVCVCVCVCVCVFSCFVCVHHDRETAQTPGQKWRAFDQNLCTHTSNKSKHEKTAPFVSTAASFKQISFAAGRVFSSETAETTMSTNWPKRAPVLLSLAAAASVVVAALASKDSNEHKTTPSEKTSADCVAAVSDFESRG